MKYLKYLAAILFFAFLLSSCGNESKEATQVIDNAAQTVKNSKSVVKEAAAMKDNIMQLREKEYLTKDDWESWLPITLYDMPLFNPQFNFMPGLGSCGATYTEGNKRIRVMVIDGAGEKGAGGVGPYRMSSKMDYNTEDDWGSTKTIVIDGVKAKKTYLKTSKSYQLSLFYAERFAVDIKTQDLPEESLEQIFNELNLSELLKLANQ